ncbi:MAG TPA: copper resistance protein CopC [Ktedonobacteraceae bacterium]|nr:copper resistance protein CopC [Ktedonobacteraceae bacterium]
MKHLLHKISTHRLVFLAVPLALCLTLLLPGIASAHAILLRSDPTKDAVLNAAPQQVRMWFSEDLNPAFTTAQVVNGQNVRVDKGDAHVTSNDTKEMDVSLKSNLPPAVYVVVYRTDSADDGHVLTGSFIFTVANPDGSVPTLSPGSNPGANVFGNTTLTGLYTGQIDGPTFFNLIMITLVELGAVFWMGAQLWANFVLGLSSQAHAEERSINERVEQRFEQRLSLPTLVVLLLANIGVLVGQAINLTGGNWAGAFSFSLLSELATSGRFGTYWSMREIVIAVALVLAIYMLVRRQRPRIINNLLPLVNLFLGALLFVAISLSSHASAVSANIVVFAVVIDWLHLLAAGLWVGGMMYIATTYLPVLKRRGLAERARSLITILPYFSPLAIAGVLIMSITGPFNATFHLSSWQQFLTTAYGRALVVKILLVGSLLLTSAVHVGLLRPRLKKEYKKYAYAVQRLKNLQAAQTPLEASFIASTEQATAAEEGGTINRGSPPQQTTTTTEAGEPSRENRLLAQQVRLREGRLAKKTQRLSSVLRWEPLLGVAVLVCVGLMNVFAGTLSPIATAAQQASGAKNQPFNATVRTSDNKFTVTLNVNPNRFGTNVFTVTVVDNKTGKPTTDVGVSLYTTMLDMDMGTDTVNLQPDGKGHFSANGDLSMPGDWQIRIQVRTPDATLHEATVKFVTQF